MELSPQAVRTTGFKTVRKGYDPDEVDAFKERVAAAVEQAQNQSAAMEARARAAVAKLQELSSAGTAKTAATPAAGIAAAAHSTDTAPAPQSTELSVTDSDNISRTLLLAQRTADATVATATTEAETITSSAHSEAAGALDEARTTAARLVAEARDEARKASEDERTVAEGEVQALIARRDFLVSDVDHLEQHVEAQRERLREAAASLTDIVERVPGGLGAMRRPLLSASDTDGTDRRAAAPPEITDHVTGGGDTVSTDVDEAITSESPEEQPPTGAH